MATIADTLRMRAQSQPDRLAFRELRHDLSERDRVTYAGLDGQARRLGERVARCAEPGQRVLLLTPSPIDYLTAFFACAYSGAVAVSGAPPYAPSLRSARHAARVERLRLVIAVSGASAVIGPRDLLDRVGEALGPGSRLALIAFEETGDAARETQWSPLDGDAHRLAALQFTSGSTSSPGGVMLRHRNLTSNVEAQRRLFELTPEDTGVSWLPMFHDLGLVAAGLLPIHAGFPCVLLPAAGFLEQPRRWLQCVSDERATISWAPNFAYHLCVSAIAPEARAGLDLSSWRIASNGAEPVQAETLRQFCDGFASVGFRPTSFSPAYGLAEATLAVSAPSPGRTPHVIRLDKGALAQDRVEAPSPDADAVELVGCGGPAPSVDLAIVDPRTLRRCAPDVVGEIWVSGPSKSEGYFGDPRPETFQARLPGEDADWLRTGDLGFIKDGDLFVTGRLKDLIVIRGANIYPQDLELSAADSHPALRRDCACAIPVDTDEEEALAIVCEIDRRREAAAPEAAVAIRRAIFERHGLEVRRVVLVRFGEVPKTPSGKVQRRLCRTELEAGHLAVVFEDRKPPPAAPGNATRVERPRTPAAVRAWVLERLRQAAPGAHIAVDTNLADLGLTSVQITALAGETEAVFGFRIPAAELFEFRVVSDIVRRLLAPPT